MAQKKSRPSNVRAASAYKANNQISKNKIKKLKKRFNETGEPFIAELIAECEKSGVKYSRKPPNIRNSITSKNIYISRAYRAAMNEVQAALGDNIETCNKTAEEQLCALLNIKPRISRKARRKVRTYDPRV